MQQTVGSLLSPGAPMTPTTPTTPSPTAARKDNVWRSVFSPRSNLATRSMGSQMYDKPEPNSPTVYDWSLPSLPLFIDSFVSAYFKTLILNYKLLYVAISGTNIWSLILMCRMYSGETRSKHHR